MTDSTRTSTPPASAALEQARILVRIPGPLRPLAAGSGEVQVIAGTVGQALEQVVDAHPGLRRHLRTEAGALREHVNVFLNEDDVRYLDGERTTVAEGDAVTIVPSIAGG